MAAKLIASERRKVVLPQPEAPKTIACPRINSTDKGRWIASAGSSNRPITGLSAPSPQVKRGQRRRPRSHSATIGCGVGGASAGAPGAAGAPPSPNVSAVGRKGGQGAAGGGPTSSSRAICTAVS